MTKERIKKTTAVITALTMFAGTSEALLTPSVNISASEILEETGFDYKMYPWRICEASPAHQDFELTNDGTLHIKIFRAQGEDKEKWDLQLRYRNINFAANHTYTVSFRAKAKREGMELCSRIGNIKGDEDYFVLYDDKMQAGPHMGGSWGNAALLTTEWQTFTGEFTPDRDLESCEWVFYYADGTEYEGNAIDGDEIWFDDMSIYCNSCNDCVGYGYYYFPGVTRRTLAGDVNCDGTVDITDITELAAAMTDKISFNFQIKLNADVDMDGEITLADLARIKQYISNQITSLE